MRVIRQWRARELPQTKAEALRQLADSVEREEALVLQLTQQQPAVEFYEAVTDSRSAIPMAEAAKVLGFPDMGQNNLFAFLRDKGLLQGSPRHKNMPYQKYIDAGYFRVVEQRYTTPEGETRISLRCLVLQKGLDYIRKLLSASL